MTRCGNKSDHCAVVDIRRRRRYTATCMRYPARSGDAWSWGGKGSSRKTILCRRVCGRRVPAYIIQSRRVTTVTRGGVPERRAGYYKIFE